MRRRYAVSTIGESMSNFGGKAVAETYSKYQKLISEESEIVALYQFLTNIRS